MTHQDDEDDQAFFEGLLIGIPLGLLLWLFGYLAWVEVFE